MKDREPLASFRLPADLLELAKKTATAEGIGFSELVRRGIDGYLNGGMPAKTPEAKPQCAHPVNRRIGKFCAECGTSLKK